MKITEIQRFSLHDGPGIRTTVFFHGCNLRCRWCHNPESFSPLHRIMRFSASCLHCGNCAQGCPVNAVTFANAECSYDREKCTGCGECTAICPAACIKQAGREISTEEVISVLQKDISLFRESDGGVTFSGGEPLLQPEAVMALARWAKQQGVSTALESAWNVPACLTEQMLPLIDRFFCDIKAFDSKLHAALTGVENRQILQNIRLLDAAGAAITLRVPLIPGCNDNPDNLHRTAAFAASLSTRPCVELLAFHKLAQGKYAALGIAYPAQEYPLPTRQQLEAAVELFAGHGVTAFYA